MNNQNEEAKAIPIFLDSAFKDCSHPDCGCEDGQCKADEYNDQLQAEHNKRVGALIYQGNTVSYMYSKAKNYGETIIRMHRALTAAGYATNGRNNDVEDMLNAALTAKTSSPPLGYRVVPIEPTTQMCVAALTEARFQYGHGITIDSAVHLYRAMLAAAPKQEE